MTALNQLPSFLLLLVWTSTIVQSMTTMTPVEEPSANVSEIRTTINRRFAFMDKELDSMDKDCTAYTSKMVMFCYQQLQDESEQYGHVSCCSYARFEDCIDMKEQEDEDEFELLEGARGGVDSASTLRRKACSDRIIDVRKSLQKLAGGDACFGHDYPSPSCILFFYQSVLMYTLAAICALFILRCCWKACCVSHRVPPKPAFVYYRKTETEPV